MKIILGFVSCESFLNEATTIVILSDRCFIAHTHIAAALFVVTSTVSTAAAGLILVANTISSLSSFCIKIIGYDEGAEQVLFAAAVEIPGFYEIA